MKHRIRRSLYILIAVMLILPVSVVFANWLPAPATIVDDLAIGGNPSSVYGIAFEPTKQTFFANGRHWIFYDNNDSDLVYKTAPTSGVFGAEIELINNSGLYGWEFAVWFDEPTTTVHMARHNMTPNPDEVQYRMGTPNADGTITWAAVWQTVATVPAVLVNWRTTICVDELGYPWVAWVDTDGTNDFGIIYVESSSTKNGTWTEDVTTVMRAGSGGLAEDNTGTMTGSPIDLDIGLNQPTVTVAGTFDITIPLGGSGTAATGGWVVDGSPKALVEGVNTITVDPAGAGTIDLTMTLNEHVWFVALTPINNEGDLIELEWSAENIASHDVGLYASTFNTDTNTWSTRETVVAEGSFHAARWDAFSFYDLGASMFVAYTNLAGSIMVRGRSQIQTWDTAPAADEIKAHGGDILIPTISGYELGDGGVGDNLICIVSGATNIWYATHDYAEDLADWNAFIEAWEVPDPVNDYFSRHIASYKYYSPVGFAWQWTDDSEATDTVQYWWIDQDQLGLYEGGLSTVAVPMANLVPLIFLVFGVFLILALAFADSINIKILIIIAIAAIVLLAFLSSINGLINSF